MGAVAVSQSVGSIQRIWWGVSWSSSHWESHSSSSRVASTRPGVPRRSKVSSVRPRTGSWASRTMVRSVFTESFQWISRMLSPGR